MMTDIKQEVKLQFTQDTNNIDTVLALLDSQWQIGFVSGRKNRRI